MSGKYFAITTPESSKIVTIVGELDGTGINILHHAISESTFFKAGKIQEAIPDAVQAIRHTLPACDSDIIIESTHLGISGALSTQVNAQNTITIPPHRQITLKDKQTVDSAAIPALDASLPVGYELLDYVPLHYYVGPEKKLDPLGHQGDSLTVAAVGIAADKNSMNVIEECLHRASVTTVRSIPLSTAAAHATLISDEKYEAMAVIDIGHCVTNVSVCVDGKIIASKSFLSGGESVTQDIREVFNAKDPEEVKHSFGSCVPSLVKNAELIPVKKTNGEIHLESQSKLAAVIQARVEIDIIAPILKYIDKEIIPLTKLSGGIVLVGGTARLKNIENLTKMIAADLGCPHILIQNPAEIIPPYINNLPDELKSPRFAAPLGVLSIASSWLESEPKQVSAVDESLSFGTSVARALAGVFGA